MGKSSYHTPVLLPEVVTYLQPRSGGLYVDGTVGGGGHAAEILKASGPDGQLIGLDWDDEAIAAARERLSEFGARVQLVRANFADLKRVLMGFGMTAVDGIMMDLGVSSRQFDAPARGFSFAHEGPLDMRMNRQLPRTAQTFLRTSTAEELADLFYIYGEERRSRAIARAIVDERQRGATLGTTTQLARLVERVLGGRRGKIHPATRVFQALRIAVNDELENLRRGLEAAVDVLKPGGRLAVISFHSLEDRIVKRFIVERSQGDAATLRRVTKKPLIASEEEIAANARARSAKLRVAERTEVSSIQ